MSNSAFIVQGPDPQSSTPFNALKIIDLGGGQFAIRRVEQSEPTLPALASEITNTGDELVAGAAASIAIGTTITGGTPGSVLFVGAGPVLAQDNAQLFWDDTNNRLGIGTATPAGQLDIVNAAWAPAATANDLVQITATRINNVSADLATFALTVTGGGNGATALNVENVVSTLDIITQTAIRGSSTLSGVQGSTVSTFHANLFITGGGDAVSGQCFSSLLLQNNAGSASGALAVFSADVSLTAGSVTDLRGLHIGGWTLGATITNSDGILIDNTIPNTLSTHFAIRSLSTAPSLITGELRLAGLTINGFIFIGANNAIQSTAAATDGQLLIGRTGNTPVAATLTAGSNITITNGAGSITIAVTAGGSFTVAAGAAATPSLNFTGSTTTGLFTPNADELGFSIATIETARLVAAGLRLGANELLFGADLTADDAGLIRAGAAALEVTDGAGGQGSLDASEYQVAGTKVVGAQGAAVADAAGGATVDAEARTAINTLLARLRDHGLIAT